MKLLREMGGSGYKFDIKNKKIKNVWLKGSAKFIAEGKPSIPIFSFQVLGHHNHDIATGLDSKGIAVRSGHHCAMPLMEYLGISGCIRVSLAPYNTKEEVDYLVLQLKAMLNLNAESDSNNEVTDQNLSLSVKDIESIFAECKGWDGKHRQIMLLGKAFSRMDIDKRSDENLITGCESSAWLRIQNHCNGKYYFEADSDAKVIRGLLAVIFAAINGKTEREISGFDFEKYFEELGLFQHLSPSRGNGLKAIVKMVRELVLI